MTEPEAPTTLHDNQVEEEYEDEDEGYEDDGDEIDAEAEAEEIARRLGDQLWADISRAQADRAGAATPVASKPPAPKTSLTTPQTPSTNSSPNHISPKRSAKKREAAILSMRGILAAVEKDPLAHSILSSSIVPGLNNESVLNVFKQTVSSGTVTVNDAKALHAIVLSLAGSKTLFSGLRHSNASSIQLEQGKRKRDETDESWADDRALKRPFMPQSDLQMEVAQAVRVVTQALSANAANKFALNPSMVASIQLQLHQIFLFAVTSSAGGGAEMNPLQEISGLIQVLGVLSGIQIGPTPGLQPPERSGPFSSPASGPSPWAQGASAPAAITDIGTAVYPCLVLECRKTFSRLYSLRAHQRVHAVHRPFRCSTCPASFARNHDLKRHAKLHEKRAWKCGGCNKMFSRRDAIKRHKNGSKLRGGKGEACLNAEIKEVDLEEPDGEEMAREERRAKMWNNGFGVPNVYSGAVGYGSYAEDTNLEEGEVPSAVISQAQSAVMSLQGLLQIHVTNALGAPSGHVMPPGDPTSGQLTLASVIARAQLQNLPFQLSNQTAELPPTNLPDATSSSPSLPDGPSEQLQPQVVLNPDLPDHPLPTALSMYGLSEEQTKMLELAIANAASAAQAQAEAEAALEEEEDVYDEDEEGYGDGDQPTD